ncbi:aminotransferase class IV [Candidatus Parcubacteria bacterium]|nr:aminotransferase class IV [Candidatus Parcubacteria bacterium]
MKENYVYLNGEILPVSEATVNVYDIGILRGYGIYEGIKTYNNKPFFLKEHLDRFRSSAKAIHLKIPISDAEIAKAIDDLVVKNGFKETNIRMILTGGNTLNGIEYDYDKPTFYMLAEESTDVPDHFYTDGCKLITFDHQRQYPEYKTTNYITGVNLQNLRKEKGALEILFVHDGKILECATSNFFAFHRRRIS